MDFTSALFPLNPNDYVENPSTQNDDAIIRTSRGGALGSDIQKQYTPLPPIIADRGVSQENAYDDGAVETDFEKRYDPALGDDGVIQEGVTEDRTDATALPVLRDAGVIEEDATDDKMGRNTVGKRTDPVLADAGVIDEDVADSTDM